MNTIWSKQIQSSEILYYSRFARFNEYNKQDWFNLLEIKDNLKVLEVGCGPGHFAHQIKKDFPTCDVFAVDLDENHINFAQNIAKNLNLDINFCTADVLDLPFKDEEFDLIYSHTLVEHLPFDTLISELKRVLKPGGKIISMHVNPKQNHTNNFSYLENEIDAIYEKLDIENSSPTVGNFILTPCEYLTKLNENNFINSKVSFKEIMYYAPDFCETTTEANDQINAQENAEIYNALFNIQKAKNGEKYKDILLNLIYQKYTQRRIHLLKGQKVNDFETTSLTIYTATKNN